VATAILFPLGPPTAHRNGDGLRKLDAEDVRERPSEPRTDRERCVSITWSQASFVHQAINSFEVDQELEPSGMCVCVVHSMLAHGSVRWVCLATATAFPSGCEWEPRPPSEFCGSGASAFQSWTMASDAQTKSPYGTATHDTVWRSGSTMLCHTNYCAS